MFNKNTFILITVILIIWYLKTCKETSYFGSGPVAFVVDNSSDTYIDNNRLEPVYQKIKLSSYL